MLTPELALINKEKKKIRNRRKKRIIYRYRPMLKNKLKEGVKVFEKVGNKYVRIY
ncbi:MAG: hypothetical protein ABIM30_00400 [candidate division WOR-3 bacterium]